MFLKLKAFQFKPRKRRGLSTLVGTLLFVTLMVATFTTLGQALDAQTDLVEVAREVSDKGLKKIQEDFDVSLSTDENLILDVTVINNGNNPVEIFTMIITNGTDAAGGYPTKVYDIPSETSFIAAGKESNILSTTNMTMALNNNYEIKVISAIGTIKIGTMICDDSDCGYSGYSSLEADLFMDPPFGIPTKNVTAVLNVKNVGRVPLTEVQPNFQLPDTSWIVHSPSSSMTGPSFDSTAPVTLEPQESAIFKWDLIVDGDVGDVWNFTNAARGTDPALNVITSLNSTDQIVLINPNDCGGCDDFGEGTESLIILDDLLIRPSIFMTIPSPFGDSDNQGIWGINVANPTNSTISIPRVSITAISPGSQNQALVFGLSGQNDCSPSSIGTGYHSVPDNWVCIQENVLQWQDYTTPISMPPFSAQSFLVKATPGAGSAGTGVSETILISANVFSSSGAFGKDDYQTVMLGGSTQTPGNISNVYLSDNETFSWNDIQMSRLNMTSGSEQNFKIFLADMDLDDEHAIGIGTKLIINVPRDWTDVELLECDGFDDTIDDNDCVDDQAPFNGEPSVKTHGDGTTQIIGTTKQLIGKVNSNIDKKFISFNATAPTVEVDRMWVMYTLASGMTDVDDGPIGATSEIILHVSSP